MGRKIVRFKNNNMVVIQQITPSVNRDLHFNLIKLLVNFVVGWTMYFLTIFTLFFVVPQLLDFIGWKVVRVACTFKCDMDYFLQDLLDYLESWSEDIYLLMFSLSFSRATRLYGRISFADSATVYLGIMLALNYFSKIN